MTLLFGFDPFLADGYCRRESRCHIMRGAIRLDPQQKSSADDNAERRESLEVRVKFR